jgi:hypothetical protein
MGDYVREKSYPQVNAAFKELEKADASTISKALLEVDEEHGITPLMYTILFLRPRWISRILNLALRAETLCDKSPICHLRKTMFEKRNYQGENAFLLLLDAEQIDAEEKETAISKRNINVFLSHGAQVDDTNGGKSALQYIRDTQMEVVLCGSCSKTRSKKNRSVH